MPKLDFGRIKLESSTYKMADLTEKQAKSRGKVFHDAWKRHFEIQKEKEIMKNLRAAKKRKREQE